MAELELEESELFDQEDVDVPLAKIPLSAEDDFRLSSGGGAQRAGSSSDDEETGLVLDFDDMGSASSAERAVPTTHVATPATADEDATRHSAEFGSSIGASSEVGSLKRFDSLAAASVGHIRRTFGSEGDLALGASAPTRAFAVAMPAPKAQSVYGGAAAAATFDAPGAYLGTSMPIRIPMMHRKAQSGTSPASFEGGRAATFVPPHLLDATTTIDAFTRGEGSVALSPSAAVRREKLMTRNAILRSTGFIEVQSFAAPAVVVGEVIDAVKETIFPVMATGTATATDKRNEVVAMPKRHRATSSLSSQLLASPAPSSIDIKSPPLVK